MRASTANAKTNLRKSAISFSLVKFGIESMKVVFFNLSSKVTAKWQAAAELLSALQRRFDRTGDQP
jgi:hypothetical protein